MSCRDQTHCPRTLTRSRQPSTVVVAESVNVLLADNNAAVLVDVTDPAVRDINETAGADKWPLTLTDAEFVPVSGVRS